MKKLIKLYLILLTILFLNSQSIAQINGKLIGEQIWMTSNLNISKFQNGDPIHDSCPLPLHLSQLTHCFST